MRETAPSAFEVANCKDDAELKLRRPYGISQQSSRFSHIEHSEGERIFMSSRHGGSASCMAGARRRLRGHNGHPNVRPTERLSGPSWPIWVVSSLAACRLVQRATTDPEQPLNRHRASRLCLVEIPPKDAVPSGSPAGRELRPPLFRQDNLQPMREEAQQ